MSVKAITVTLPTRAWLWLKWKADRKHTSPEALARDYLLRQLNGEPDVNLEDNPRWDCG